jgi:hypothetical protein
VIVAKATAAKTVKAVRLMGEEWETLGGGENN